MIADILLNFSGHKLTNRARSELSKGFGAIEEIPVPTISFEQDVERQIREIVRQVRTRLDGSITVAIIPPGQATVAILLMAYLNGILGYFPTLCYLSAETPGDYLPQSIFSLNPQKMRDKGKALRQTQWVSHKETHRATELPKKGKRRKIRES